MLGRPWIAPALASIGFAGLVATFAVETRSFRRAVESWAARDLAARAQLAAANLNEPLRTGDFRRIYAFGADCEREGLQVTVFSSGGGVFYDSRGKDGTPEERVYAAARASDFTIRLGLPRSRVLAPFRRARTGFVLAALAGGVGMLFVFFFTYRQHVRIRELRRVENFRRAFVADVSHELKTPLTGILGAVDLLASGLGDEPAERSKLLAMIGRESKRLNALAQGILDLARLEREGERLSLVETDVGELVRDACAPFAAQAEPAGVALSVCAATAEPIMLTCDAQRIVQAVGNLVGNALRHAQTPDVVVTFGKAGGMVTIAVEDHGKGIPPAEVERVFERFHRIDPARATETGGAGLGLAIVRRIAALHGGTVKLTTANPHGCRFVLTLPSKALPS